MLSEVRDSGGLIHSEEGGLVDIERLRASVDSWARWWIRGGVRGALGCDCFEVKVLDLRFDTERQ